MAMQQEPHPQTGWRKTRWAIIRNTYRMLETSTIKTWLAQFPEHVFGRFKMSPPFRHLIKDEASRFEMEVIFLALDDEQNVRDLLSTEWTGCFINEAREIPKGLVDNIVSRMRRYPARDNAVGYLGATRPGVVADTNAPGADHWWPVLAGDSAPPEHWSETERRLHTRPPGWEFFAQPPAVVEVKHEGEVTGYNVNQQAENLENLHPEYYADQYHGKDRDWIEVYLMNRYRTIKAGKPVYPDFDQERHLYKRPTGEFGGPKIDRHSDLILGCDFGLTPAAVLIERSRTGYYTVLEEFVAIDMTIPKFGEWLAKELGYRGLKLDDFSGWGDPSGDTRDQEGETAFNLMRATGIMLSPAPTNDPSIRIAAVTNLLTKTINKRAAIKVAPNCRYLTQGFIHGYRYRRKKVHGEVYEERPDKTGAGAKYTHVHDALQYAVLGAGEGRVLLNAKTAKPVTVSRAERNFNVWGRHSRR